MSLRSSDHLRIRTMTADHPPDPTVCGAELLPNTEIGHYMRMPLAIPRYTAEEVRRFPDDRLRYEVIRGELFVTPAPGTPHQRAVRELCTALHAYVVEHGLGEALPAPFEVEFTDDSAVQPDVLVTLAPQGERLTRERLYGPPALVVEVVSYSSKRTDRLQKRQLYQEEGVPEYWIVDLDARHVERWQRGAMHAGIVTRVLSWQPVASVPPLSIDLETLFRTVWAGLP